MPVARSRFTPTVGFNPVARRYVDLATGRFVSWERGVRPALDKALERAQGRVVDLARQRVAREITTAEFQVGVAREAKTIHTYSAVLARGGWAQMTSADWGAVGHHLRDEYAALAKFGAQIERGEQALNGQVVARARQYAQAGRSTFEATRTRLERGAGMDEVRSIRHANDSCDDCVEQEAAGWQSFDTFIPIGERQCLRNCHCTAEYRDSRVAV